MIKSRLCITNQMYNIQYHNVFKIYENVEICIYGNYMTSLKHFKSNI